jgi:hypothetical protein
MLSFSTERSSSIPSLDSCTFKQCTTFIAKQHEANRGKTTLYSFTSKLEHALGFKEVLIDKNVGELGYKQLYAILSQIGSNIIISLQKHLEIRLEGGRLTIFCNYSNPPAISEAANYINNEYKKIQETIEIINNPLERINARRILMRSLFSLIAQQSFSICREINPHFEGRVTIALMGSYNHAPLTQSDFDFLIAYNNKENAGDANLVVEQLEQIIALTPIEASNIIRVGSSGNYNCINIAEFKKNGLGHFESSPAITRAINNITFVEGVGSYANFLDLKEAIKYHSHKNGVTYNNGAELTTAFINPNQRAPFNIQNKARLIEKFIATALDDLQTHYRTCMDPGVNYIGAIKYLHAIEVIDGRTVCQLSNAIYFSRSISEFLSFSKNCNSIDNCAKFHGYKSIELLEKEVSTQFRFAKEFLLCTKKRCGISKVEIYLANELLKVKRYLDYLNAKYIDKGRQIKVLH